MNSPQEFLSSRDEVLKKVDNVGEDNSESSYNLFHGNVILPPSYCNESFDELWDEEEGPEEVEIVIEAVPSANHNNLDKGRFVLPLSVIIILNWRGLCLQLGSSRFYQTKSQRHSGPKF
ncbi:hypothetical protein O181_111620 [Austropuccinia psidii MF-1]|uniref:Uncharacterized protein n=1 Tax=Austropuccinia psidii MF-1 TaxID=1389203 RepID=A0A9Q3JYS6_9BASI|nr:hypothetical protein [Austropuccinia psidii MF-1]